MKLKINKRDLKLIGYTLLAGLFLGWLFFHNSRKPEIQEPNTTGIEHSHEGETEATIWTCSMHPQIRMDEPGQCPICGMDLIPLADAKANENAAPGEIQMTEAAIKLASIQTVTVTKGIPEKTVALLGKVKPDERRIAELTARFGGRIEKLFVNFTGQNVRKGQKLATIYSPELIAAQRELLEALKYKDSNPGFYRAARTKLKLWDLNDQQIDALENSGEPMHYFEVLSPVTGTVTMRHVALGDYVKEGSALFEVIDLTKIWVMFDAYETDLPWIRMGDEISFTIQSLPGKNYSGKVTYIDPFINGKTRVARVRVELRNPGLVLKPEMFANGILKSKMKQYDQILIPKSSVLWTGKRAVVYVKVPDRFEPSFLYREIVLGPEAGNFYVVESGLMEGEEIAVNGVFKIDAAAQLAGKPSMMNPTGGKIQTGHAGMDMGGGGGEEMQQESQSMDPSSIDKVEATQTPEAFKKQLATVVDTYMELKDAFVASREPDIESAAKKVLAVLEKVDMSLLKGDAHNNWMKLLKPIRDNLNGIVQMKGIEMKRSHFRILSDKLTEAVKSFGISSGETVYLEFCPMANDNKGAFWLSLDKEIKNPYFGDKMLTCGEVKETFKK